MLFMLVFSVLCHTVFGGWRIRSDINCACTLHVGRDLDNQAYQQDEDTDEEDIQNKMEVTYGIMLSYSVVP